MKTTKKITKATSKRMPIDDPMDDATGFVAPKVRLAKKPKTPQVPAPWSPHGKTPAQGGPPEVTMENGTTLVLPNPADAPAPPKRKAKNGTEPKVIEKDGPVGPVTDDIPEWARKAAAKKSGDEGWPADAATEAPQAPAQAPAKANAPRKPKAAPDAPTSRLPASKGSIRAVGMDWLDRLTKDGHTEATVASYARDLEIAFEWFGAETPASEAATRLAEFNESEAVTKKANGKPKAMPTILKTRRAVRMALGVPITK